MILCADDYGISPAVSAGIIELIEEKRISAASCMTLGPYIEKSLEQLRQIKNKTDLGLHLVLTDDWPLTPLKQRSGLVDTNGRLLPFPKLVMNAYKRTIDFGAVSREIEAQINRFHTLMGRVPDFIDGHQHVHQLPVIRKALARALQNLAKNHQNIYTRISGLPMKWLWTKGLTHSWKFTVGNAMISLPRRSMARLMREANIPHNRFLLGFYDYESGTQFENIFHRYLTLKPEPRDIFFCHPGYVDEELRRRDPLLDSRTDVLEFLRSPRCKTMMDESGIGLNTFF